MSYESGVFFLEDLKSRNCTYIGSTKLKPYQSHKVESQELINFGGLVATIEIPPLSEKVNSNPSKKHECPVCERQFSQITNMQLHLNVHKDDPKVEKIKAGWEEKNSKVFTKKSAPFVIDALKKLRALHCKDCKISFKTKDLLTKHMEELHANKETIPETNQSKTSSNQDNSSTVNSKTIIFRPSETMKNVYSKKFIPRTITLNEGEKIIVEGYNDKRTINASNLVFEGNLLSNMHATFSLKENVLYLQDHSTNNTSITPANGVSMEINHGKSVVVNSFDTINFGSCPDEGVITEVEFLSDYEVKRLSNIEEKNQQIPPKVSSILPPKP